MQRQHKTRTTSVGPATFHREISNMAAKRTRPHVPYLVWQKRRVAGVQVGIEDADRGNFASEEEIAAVLNKFGQA